MMHVCMCVHMYVCTHVCVCMHACVCVCIGRSGQHGLHSAGAGGQGVEIVGEKRRVEGEDNKEKKFF